MDRKIYYFSNCTEDHDLSKSAVKAKEIVQQIDHIIKIFNDNNEKLYGPSPRRALFLIQRNNKSVFLPSSSNESTPRMSTSIRCNPDTSSMPRKYLPLDDAEKKEHHPATLMEFSTPIGHQTPVHHPEVETILNTTMDKTGTNDEKSVPRVQAQNSPENTEGTVSRISGAQLNISPNETITEMARDDRKRKSLSPRKRSTRFLKSMPRVIKSAEDEISIEVVDLEYAASPRISRSRSADYRSDSTNGSVKSPVDGKSETDTSPKAPERHSRPLERKSSVFSRNLSGKRNPTSGGNFSAGKNTADIESNLTLLKETIEKFNMLFDERDMILKNSFVPFQEFQRSINFINSYVHQVLNFILTFDVLGKCSREEFKEIVLDANAISRKLINMLQSWEKDADRSIYAWHKCFKQSEQLKARCEPAVAFEIFQECECKMTAIFKKMNYLIMQEESMRALFSYIGIDVERLTKMLVKCFILVGILQSR